MKLYTFLLHHDNSYTVISTMATDLNAARDMICKAENCPGCALE